MGTIRLILAFAVLAGHARVLDFEILSGDAAVRAFFVISGFYMSLILTGKYAGRSKTFFYSSRLLRLYPGYLAALALQAVLLLAWDLHPLTTKDTVLFAYTESGIVAVVHLFTNLLVFGQEALYWLGVDLHGGGFFWSEPDGHGLSAFTLTMLPQAWALSVEFCFYLLAPFFVMRRTLILLALMAASLAVRAAIYLHDPGYGEFMQRFLPSQLYLFIAGMLAHRFYRHIIKKVWISRAGLPMLGVLVACIFCFDFMGVYRDAAFIVILSVSMPAVFLISKENGLDRFMGRLSYPFYLLHFPLLTAYEYMAESYSPALLLLLICSCSVIMLLAIEYPVDRYRMRKYSRSWEAQPELVRLAPQVSDG